MRLLALIPEASGTRACLEAAAAAAGIDPEAWIEALHVKVDPLLTSRIDEEAAFQRLREHFAGEGSADERARATWAEFEAWRAAAPTETARRVLAHEIIGREEETVIHESCGADLLVMARPHNLDGHEALYAALFRSGKPLLLVAPHWKPDADARIERHMLIAWTPTEQARRAVAGALPWLRRADRVTVLTVEKHDQRPDPAELLDLLNREAIAAEPMTADRIEGRTSARLLAAAAELDASCLVMGAYRHNPIIDWVFGATTRRVIANATIPLLLAH